MENQSTFASLPWDSRMEIFTMIIEDLNWSELVPLLRVCKQWKVDIEFAWRCFCERRNLLRDEELLKNKFNKDWKWLCVSRTRNLTNHSSKKGVGFNWASDCVYEGEFVNGRKNGVGRLTWTNGDTLVCQYVDDMKSGFGVMSWSNGDVYEGEWAHDKRHGNALYKYANGGIYRGPYTTDERNGAGVFAWPTGEVFEGTWSFGGRRGKGVLKLPDGRIFEQEWHEPSNVNYSIKLPSFLSSPST